MKQIFIILTFAFITLPSFAQGYIPVVINGEVFFSTQLETSEGIVPAEVTVANFEKINGQLYSRVFFKRNLEADMFIGYLREDPGAGEIYFRTTTNPQEYLVYDISLEVGESITLSARWCDGLAGDIATVMSVTETDGLREIVFDRQIGDDLICEILTFTEGVGPSASLIFPVFRNAIAENGIAQSLCHASHQSVIYYPAGTDTDLCGGGITSTDALSVADEIEVFPNPVSSTLQLRGLPDGSNITVRNGYGQMIPVVFSGDRIDSGSWLAGLYLLVVELPDGGRVVRKVVKR